MMSKLKIEITEETSKEEMLGFVRAIAAYGKLDVFGSPEVFNVKGSDAEKVQSQASEPEEEEKPKKATKKTSKKTSKKTVEKEEPKEEKTSKKEETKPEEKDDTEPELKLEDIRVLARPHIKNHKPAIKSKLDDLGAESIPALDSSKYPEFAEFLKGLK